MVNYEPINDREKSILSSILEKTEGSVEFRGEPNRRYVRFGRWKSLPFTHTQLEEIGLEESVFEYMDGDFKGRTIIIEQYSYYIK